MRKLLLLALVAAIFFVSPRPLQARVTSPKLSSGARALQLYRAWANKKTHRLSPGAKARWRGVVYSENRALLKRPVENKGKKRNINYDPTFRGKHPMFKRLVRSGWYTKGATIGKLQGMANQLRQTKRINPNTPLKDVEFLSFDLEASSGRAGKYNKGNGTFKSGWDEITQFGYTIYKGGKKIKSGSIKIKPDVTLNKHVQELTGLTPAKLAHSPRFEQTASQLLKLMNGRVLIGQDAIKMDWAWMKSNFARIGVDLPTPKGLILDTLLMSRHHYQGGAGLAKLSRAFRVNQTNHHDAMYDAEATGDVFFAMARKNNVRTLGQAFNLQRNLPAAPDRPMPEPQPPKVR